MPAGFLTEAATPALILSYFVGGPIGPPISFLSSFQADGGVSLL